MKWQVTFYLPNKWGKMDELVRHYSAALPEFKVKQLAETFVQSRQKAGHIHPSFDYKIVNA